MALAERGPLPLTQLLTLAGVSRGFVERMLRDGLLESWEERVDPAEGHYAQAVIADRRKQYDAAEEQLRRAAEAAPRQVGRVMALAKYLAKRGRIDESEAMFERAARMAYKMAKIENPRKQLDFAEVYDPFVLVLL